MQLLLITLTCVCTCLANPHLQDWAEVSVYNKPHDLHCNDSYGTLFPQAGDVAMWTRSQDVDVVLTAGDHYEMRDEAGIKNFILRIKKVTDADKGIYFCYIQRSTVSIGRVIKALNNGLHDYDDEFEKYRDNVRIGGITAACIFGILVVPGMVYAFRYQSDEEMREKRERKKARKQILTYDNPALDDNPAPYKGEPNGTTAAGDDDTRL